MRNLILTSVIATAMSIAFLFIMGFKGVEKKNDSLQLSQNVPIGTIIAYGGKQADLRNYGWLRCDGRSVYVKDYPSLHTVLGGLWGKDPYQTSLNIFKLPNFEGYFLRGAEGNASHIRRYVDKSPRYRMKDAYGYNVHDLVGTYQKDYYKGHNHGGGAHNHGGGNHSHTTLVPNAGYSFEHHQHNNRKAGAKNSPTRSSQSGNIIKTDGYLPLGVELETVPKNAAVHYYIKAR